MSAGEIRDLEQQIYTLGCRLRDLRKLETGTEVSNYRFQTLTGEVSLLDLFGKQQRLLAIHNMGQACRYCTLWGDGLNPFLPHLEFAMAVVLLSKDDPATQRRFANARGWRFRIASHRDTNYLEEQKVQPEPANSPGAVCYERRDDKVYRLNSCQFGPGDLYCSIWHLLGLAGLDTGDWTPQYNYWRRPSQMEDGGENMLE
jgi:predicted dithiol-disulfide oxidoreductase (DUF899 family)